MPVVVPTSVCEFNKATQNSRTKVPQTDSFHFHCAESDFWLVTDWNVSYKLGSSWNIQALCWHMMAKPSHTALPVLSASGHFTNTEKRRFLPHDDMNQTSDVLISTAQGNEIRTPRAATFLLELTLVTSWKRHLLQFIYALHLRIRSLGIGLLIGPINRTCHRVTERACCCGAFLEFGCLTFHLPFSVELMDTQLCD